jgi:hypothetical protein
MDTGTYSAMGSLDVGFVRAAVAGSSLTVAPKRVPLANAAWYSTSVPLAMRLVSET